MNKNKTNQRPKSTDKAKNKENTSKRGKSEEKVKKRQAKEKDENGPKKNLSAYLLFCNDERPKAKADGVEGKDLMRVLADRWGKCTEKEKKKYEDLAQKDKERYERECEEAGISKEKSKSKTEAKDKNGRKSTSKKTQKPDNSKKEDKKKKSVKKNESEDEEEDDE